MLIYEGELIGVVGRQDLGSLDRDPA